MDKIKKYDVVIIGGGTSGCSCAYNCAKNNLKTLLVEKNNFLGGLMTGGLVVPIMKSSVTDLNCSFYKKLIKTAKKYNAQTTYSDNNDGWLNPELLKIVLDDILRTKNIKNNLDVLFETTVNNVYFDKRHIYKLELKNDILSIPIEAKYFVDATGVGELFIKSNCNFLSDDNVKQQNSLRFLLGNVDFDKFANFLDKLDDDKNITTTYRSDRNGIMQIHFSTASTWNTDRQWKIDKYLTKAIKDGVLKSKDRSYFQLFSVAGEGNQVAFNCPRINNYNNDAFKSSLELIEARKAIYRLYNFVKNYFDGFQNSCITSIATQTGVREYRRIKSKYVYKKNDILEQKTFECPVLRANYGIDIHSSKKNKDKLEATPSYSLPIESLMSAEIDNLFGIGMLVGADFEAHSALRVQKSCMSMGEGVANYIKNGNKT